MPDFQVLSGSERPVVAAPVVGAERSLAGTEAMLRGRSAVAEGIQQVGGTIGNAALYSARLKNRADELRIEQAIQAEERDFAAWQESEPDETKWLPEASARTARVTEQIKSMKLAPIVRREAEQRVGMWGEDRQAIVSNQAERYANKRHDEVLVSQINVAADQGDKATIETLFEERVILGTVHPQVAEAAKQVAFEKADVAQATRAMAEDPRMAIEQLEAQTDGGRWKNYKDLSETARISLTRSAKNALETMRAEHAQEIATSIDQGKVGGIDQRIDYEVKTGGITAETANHLRAFARGQRSPQDQAAAGSQLWQRAIDLDPSDPDYIQKNQRIRAESHALAPEVRDPILDTLNAKDRDEVKDDVRMVYDALDRDFRSNTFGNVQTYTQAEVDALKKRSAKEYKAAGSPKEGDPKDRASQQEAAATLFRYQRAMREFLRANPKATTEQIQQYRASLTATDTRSQLGSLAVDAISGAVQ